MKNETNIKNRLMTNNNSGFTLVELLAMISLLSIISVIVIYTATAVVEKANNKSYMVTINNIQKEAETYVLENNNIFWLTDGSDYLYQCITIQNLIDMGYFDNNILDSKIDKNKNISSTDYVYVEKNRSTKTITRSVLLYNNPQLNGLCGVDTLADGIIEFNIPSGFAKSKEITITYTLKSSIGSASNYKYSYGFDADNSSDKDIGEQSFNFNTKNKIVKKIIVNDNGWVFAKIDKLDNTNINNSNIYVDGVDTNGPVITSNATSTTVRGSVVIPVIINDIGSGIKGDSINLSDFKVSIGNKILTENFSFEKVSSNINTYNYNLKIENYNYEGEVKIVIDKDRILDNLGNGNVDTVISTGVIFSNKYTISYNSTGGTGTMNSTICTYGNTCTLSTNIFTKTGYTFLGWSTSSNTNTVVYNDKYVFNVFDNKDDIDLYAVWKANTYTIIYNANGGSGTMLDTNCTYDSNCTLRANSFTRTGYTFAGWNLKKDGTGSSYADQESVKNLTDVDGKTITLYAQWNANTYTIKYDANGGSGTMSNSTHTFGVPKNLNANKFTRTGYTFAGWNLKKDGTGGSYADQESVKNLTGVDGKTITLYAIWNANTYTIKYSANGGTGTMSDTSCTYDSNCTLRTNSFTRTGYTFNGWNTKSDGSGTSYTNSQAVKNLVSSNNGSITLYVKWTINKYTIKYNANGGSGAPGNQIKEYNVTLVLSNTKPTRSGYKFKGWSTSSTATSATYTAGGSYTTNKDVTLYAVWELDAFYLYNEGDESVTWVGRGWATDSVSPTDTVNLSRGSSSIKMTFGSYYRQSGAMVTSTMVDITNFNTLTYTGYIKPSGYTSDKAPYGFMFISQDFSETVNKTKNRRVSLPVGSSAGTVSLDISDYDGEWYIVVYMYTFNSTSMPTTITKSVKLTK